MNADWEDAISRGDVAKVRLLLDQGADINSRDGHGQTAIMRASKMGQAQLVGLLAGYGAKLDAADMFNLSALMLAVVNGRPDIGRTLVDAGADLGIRGGRTAPGFYRKTALALAHDAGGASIIKLLAEAGAPE